MSESEVARIKRQIELEYQAGKRIFDDFTPTAHHTFITKRQENIANYFQELQQHVSPDEALKIINEAERESAGEDNASI